MSIQRPYNIKVNNISINGATVDAAVANNVTWSVSGAISTAYQVQIYDNSTGSLALDSGKVTTYNLSYTIGANALLNGKEYKIVVTAFDDTSQSASSYSQIFTTSSTPVVALDTIDNPIASQSYTFSATYSQAQGVSMASWVVYLYDDSKNVIAQSNAYTTTPIQYTFDGLSTITYYYVEVQCTSVEGLVGTTGQVQIYVDYGQPTVNLGLVATNNDDSGTVELSWNVIQVLGVSNNTTFLPPEEIDATSGTVTFTDGFTIDSDFTAKVWFRSPVHNTPLITFKGANGVKIWVEYHDDNRFHVYKSADTCTKITHIASGVCNTFYFVSPSMSVPVSASTKYFVSIEQIDSNMNVYASVVG